MYLTYRLGPTKTLAQVDSLWFIKSPYKNQRFVPLNMGSLMTPEVCGEISHPTKFNIDAQNKHI